MRGFFAPLRMTTLRDQWQKTNAGILRSAQNDKPFVLGKPFVLFVCNFVSSWILDSVKLEYRMTARGGAGVETYFGVWRVSKRAQLLPGGTSIVEGRVEVTECPIGKYCQRVR